MLTQARVARLRLATQHLSHPLLTRPEQVVDALGALQAQDYAAAKWGIGLRCVGVDDAAVEAAFNAGALIRTHVLRPTWHFVRPRDLRWMLALTGPRIDAGNRGRYRDLGLDQPTHRRARRVLEKALRGRHLTRREIGTALERAGFDLSVPQRLGYILMRAELESAICSGPRLGKQLTYALVDERVPGTAAIARDEALTRLARCYFATRGPATLNDFAWWSGLTVADGRRAVGALGGEVERVDVDARPHWLIPSSAPRRARHTAHLLPNYDEYFIGFRDRSAIGLRATAIPSMTALDRHIAIVDGQIVAGWSRAATSSTVHLAPVTTLSASDRRHLAAAAARYADFVGMAVEVEIR